MCNISTDGTSINELEISTGQHTLDKGIINNTSLQFLCVRTKSLISQPPYDEELCITKQRSI